MLLSPITVIRDTLSPVAKLAMLNVKAEIQAVIERGPGETFYDLPIKVKLPDCTPDNDRYAIVRLVESAGWDRVRFVNNVLYFHFPFDETLGS